MATQPWDRTSRETDLAYDSYLKYRDMGADRSIAAVCTSFYGGDTGKNRTLEKWSARFDWVERCVAWDNHLRSERDKVAVAEARKWERRRQAALERNWDVAQQLHDKLVKMLAFPVSRQRTEKDGRTIIVEPAKWTFQTAALIAKTVAELEAATLTAVGQDPDALTDAQARAVVHEPTSGEAPPGV